MSTKPLTWSRFKALEDRANAGAWSRASAYLIFKGADLVARVRFAHPKDGAGKLQAFVYNASGDPQEVENDSPITSRLFYGWANGYGYDKRSAALNGAIIGDVTLRDDGAGWDSQLRAAGYEVHWAI